MPMQYVQDSSGRTTAVIIPIAEWLDITDKYKDLKELEDKQNIVRKNKPSDYAGILSSEGYSAINNHVEEARNEWDRNF